MEPELSQRESIFSIAITRPVAILMVVIAASVFGYVSYRQLPLNLMPDISYPTLTVRTEYPAAAPEEVESLISRPIEQQLGVIGHLVRISSVSRPELSDVILEFTWDTDMNEATQDVREKLDQATLPEEVKRPMILRYDPSLDPIVRVGLYGGGDLFALRRTADEEVRRDLEAVEGVAAVKIRGGLEEEIRVAVNEGQIALVGLSMAEVNRRLAEENINVAGGSLKDGQTEYLVRTLNEFGSVDEIGRIVIGRRNGSEIRLSDVAAVTRSHKERETITRVNGVESVEIDIYKEGDANIVAVAARVRDRLFGTEEQRAFVDRMNKGAAGGKDAPADATALAQLKKRMTDFAQYRMPSEMRLELLSDQSGFIQKSIDEVKSTAVVGGLLAVGILYLFLRSLLHTMVIGAVLPVSVLATFAAMQVFGVSLNIMSLGGLALGVGMLVDNSIVVLESIFRCREEGDDLKTAVTRGTLEVGGAVVASTLTTVAVFLPVVFVEGIAGQLFGDLALTVVFSLLASLGAALFLTPMLAARDYKGVRLMDQRSRLLSMSAVAAMRNRWRHDASFGDRARVLLRLVPQLFLELVVGIALCAGAVIPLFAKVLGSIVGVAMLPASFLVELAIGRKVPARRRFFPCLAEWAADDSVWGVRLFDRVWIGVLRLSAPGQLQEGLSSLGRWLAAGREWRRPLRWILAPPVFVYLLVRFIFSITLETFAKAATCAIVLISLFLALSLGVLGAVLFPIAIPLLTGFERAFGAVRSCYPLLLRWGLANRPAVLLLSGGLLAGCWFLLLPDLGRELIPEVHQGEFKVQVARAVGTPIEMTDQALQQAETLILRQPEVARTTSMAGVEKAAVTSSDEGEHTGEIVVTLKPGEDLALMEERTIERIRSGLSDMPETRISVSRPALFSFKTPIEVEIRGYSLERLRSVSSRVEELMREIPGLKDIKANIQPGHPELRIEYNRDLLSSRGLSIHDVATVVRSKMEGNVPTKFRGFADREIDVRVRVGESGQQTAEDLRRLIVSPDGKMLTTLAAVARISVDEGPSEIRRIDQQRAAVVKANISGRDLAGLTGDIGRAIRSVDLPSDFTFDIGGQNREMEVSLRSLKLALLLAMFLVYVVMASQFESLLHPFVIMFTIPLAVIGVIIVLYAVSLPISVMVLIGLILLAGVVVNNAIVLVDFVNQLRKRGMDKTTALVTGGQARLRPILMTTGTTVLGLLPMALGLGEGAELRMPLAITVIAGLTSSTLLTLIVIPVVYSLVDRAPQAAERGAANTAPQPPQEGADK